MNPWTQFWRQGHPTTFGEYFKEGYAGPIKNWFAQHLNGNSEVSMLELACGNGALIPVCLDLAVQGHYLGIDLADVRIPEAVQERISQSPGFKAMVRGGIAVEQIPLEAAQFDHVCSIFGLEYSDTSKTVPEIGRVIRDCGAFLGVLHHNESIVSTMSARALNEYNLNEVRDFLEQLEIIAKQADKTADIRTLASNPKAEKARKKINAYADKYMRDTDLSSANASMFEFVSQGLKFFKVLGRDGDMGHRFIKAHYAETLAARERHRQMCSVALSQDQIELFCQMLEKAGFTKIDVSVIKDQDTTIGWGVCALKQA